EPASRDASWVPGVGKRAGGILLCPEERGRRAAPWKKKLALAAATIAKIDAPTLRRSDAPTLRRSDAPTLSLWEQVERLFSQKAGQLVKQKILAGETAVARGAQRLHTCQGG